MVDSSGEFLLCTLFPMLKNFKFHFCSRNAYLEQQNYICSLSMLFILRYKKNPNSNTFTHLKRELEKNHQFAVVCRCRIVQTELIKPAGFLDV